MLNYIGWLKGESICLPLCSSQSADQGFIHLKFAWHNSAISLPILFAIVSLHFALNVTEICR